jgi:hypothetical protein
MPSGTGSSTTLLLLFGLSPLEALQSLRAPFREPQEALALLSRKRVRARLPSPEQSFTCPRASSRLARARASRGARGRRRARSVPTDVYNPRDLFSTTSTFVSVHSAPLFRPFRDGPPWTGSDRSHADRPLGRAFGPRARLSLAFVPSGPSPLASSSPCRAADVRCELRARVMRERWSVDPEAPRERSVRGLDRSRKPFTPCSPPVAGRLIGRSQARSPRTRR